ncbi:serine hydrolase domain-containing protein [Spongiivirga citrea]|uniref:Serine hydrolase n=1 Tax=Spongiivirga citrea TaxID=1481457 RepID=A0A6M0CKU2_9FLAO|nr:serine hydrolase [Spongiivirga citrea]NER16604.1 serine hydrolase [Spongiivirga citrea]
MKRFIRITGIVFILLGCIAFFFRDELWRLHFALKMFSGVEQVERFKAVEDYFPVNPVNTVTESSAIQTANTIALPETYTYENESFNTKGLLEKTDVTSLIVLKNNAIVFEEYYQGFTREDHTIVWSVTKSIVSALVGTAVDEGHIRSIKDAASDYVEELKGTAYEGVTIKNLLQMSSGVSWNEDYSDDNSDINRFGRTLALGGSFESFVKTLTKDKPQGTYNRYNSSDTQVLGMVLIRSTGKSLSAYLEEKIWKPLGMEQTALWLVDDQGNEFAAAGLSTCARDMARFGLLYLNNGKWNNNQIINNEWINLSITPDAPHLLPGQNPNSNNEYGYGFQWWLLDNTKNTYAAMGIYNQMIYINPGEKIVIVKTAANNNYGTTNDESSFKEQESLAFIHAVVHKVVNENVINQ